MQPATTPIAFEQPSHEQDNEQLVSQFLEQARRESDVHAIPLVGDHQVIQQPQQLVPSTSRAPTQPLAPPTPQSSGRAKAREAVVTAEKFKAGQQPLPGEVLVNAVPATPIPSNQAVDDQFFHLTCHVDPQLAAKIERGEFIDLEKIMPKNNLIGGTTGVQHMELVNKDGNMYFSPVADKGSKITGIRKWEQAFRIYAVIYSRANPHRSSEIWQYVHVINTAASSYIWDNVSQYDVVFRQLMGAHPERNWSNIYNHMWNLTMRDPINKGGGNSSS